MLFGLLFLVVCYANSFYFMIANLVEFNKSGIYYVLYSIAILGISLAVWAWRLGKKSMRLTIKSCLVLVSAVMIVISFAGAWFIHGNANTEYNTALLTMGVRVVPALIIGSLIDLKNDYDDIVKWIPPFVLLYTVAVLLCVLRVMDLSLGVQSYNNEINTYQSLSYDIAYAYSLNIIWIGLKKNRYLRFIMSALIPFQLYCLLRLGGRGAFVLVGMVTLYYFCSKKDVLKLIVLTIGAISAVIVVKGDAIMAGVDRLLGFMRNFGTDNSVGERIVLYTNALEIFKRNPVFGSGIGSIYSKLNSRSHNIFLDVMIESGVIGLLVSIFFLGYIFYNMRRLVKVDSKYNLLIAMFLSSFVMLLFSGYYLNESGLWLIGATVVVNTRRIQKEAI